MHVLKANYHTSYEEFSLCFCEPFLFVLVVSEISTRDQVGDQVNIFEVSKGIEHIDQEASQ